MPNPEVFYIEPSEYKGLAEDGETAARTLLSTTAPALVDPLSDAEVTALLLEAMVQIDAYVGDGWETLEDGQEFTFPRCQDTDDDGNAVIPRTVALATRMVADAIITKRKRGVLPHEVASESKLGHSYSKRSQADARPGFEHWPPEACAMLDEKYVKKGGYLVTEDPSLAEC